VSATFLCCEAFQNDMELLNQIECGYESRRKAKGDDDKMWVLFTRSTLKLDKFKGNFRAFR
jgi:hypothetical protein